MKRFMQRPMQNVYIEKKSFPKNNTPCCLGVEVQTVLAKSKTLHKVNTFLILLTLLHLCTLYYVMLKIIMRCCF